MHVSRTRITRAAAYAAALSALALAPVTTPARAQAASSDDIAALREQIRLLDQKIRVLERNQELKEEAATAAAKAQPKITASDGRLEIASSDGANSIRLRGLVQGDGRFYLDNADAAQDRFLLRRARLIFEGKFAERFSYVVQPEFAGSTVSILDANVSTSVTPEFSVRVGRFKTPVGLEQLQSDPVAFFNERSIATNLAPNRDVGVELFGGLGQQRVNYQVSVTNGVIDGGNSNPASDNNEGDFTLAGRLFFTPFVNDKESPLKGLGFGVAGAAGNYRGSSTASLLSPFRTDGQQTFFQYRAASGATTPSAANTTVANGTASVISPQLYYYVGPFGLLAEYFRSETELSIGSGATLNAREVQNEAYNLSVGYVLTGEESTFRGVTPRTSFNPSKGTWGAFEIVARIAQVDVGDEAFFDPAGAAISLASLNNATEVTSYGLGLNWYLSRAVRAGVNVFQSDFKLNDGNTIAPTGSALSDDETSVITRVQVSF